jgi:tetratricopeptide (TPR) repeat protein
VNPEVHRLVLQGRYFWNQFLEPALGKAESAFQQALAIEGDCAAAHAGLANVWCRRVLVTALGAEDAAAMLNEARTHATPALAADPGLAEPHAVLGMVALVRSELEESAGAFERALATNPNCDLALVYYARLLSRQGRVDLAVHKLEEAQRLSPIVAAFSGHRATALIGAGRHIEAVAVANRAAEIGGGTPWTHAVAALALARASRSPEAIREARFALNAENKVEWPTGLTQISDGLGDG